MHVDSVQKLQVLLCEIQKCVHAFQIHQPRFVGRIAAPQDVGEFRIGIGYSSDKHGVTLSGVVWIARPYLSYREISRLLARAAKFNKYTGFGRFLYLLPWVKNSWDAEIGEVAHAFEMWAKRFCVDAAWLNEETYKRYMEDCMNRVALEGISIRSVNDEQ